jgi:glycerophosphoryl diester phosphodiesterase
MERILNWIETGCDRVMDFRRFPEAEHKPAPLTIAHRGAWDAGTRENTLEAFAKAKMAGMCGVELDVRFTRDGVPVVHHDPDLIRFHGSSTTIESLTFAELHAQCPEIPALAEVLCFGGLHFMIEIKTPLGSVELATLGESLAPFEPVRDFHLLTLDPELIKVTPKFPARSWVLVGQVQLRTLVEISVAHGYGGVAGHYLGMTTALIERLHAHGQKAGAGFIPSLNLLNRERARGVDWVFTNSAERLRG